MILEHLYLLCEGWFTITWLLHVYFVYCVKFFSFLHQETMFNVKIISLCTLYRA